MPGSKQLPVQTPKHVWQRRFKDETCWWTEHSRHMCLSYLIHANNAKKVPNAWSKILEKFTVAQVFKNIPASQRN
jgi:hypothetical protein